MMSTTSARCSIRILSLALGPVALFGSVACGSDSGGNQPTRGGGGPASGGTQASSGGAVGSPAAGGMAAAGGNLQAGAGAGAGASAGGGLRAGGSSASGGSVSSSGGTSASTGGSIPSGGTSVSQGGAGTPATTGGGPGAGGSSPIGGGGTSSGGGSSSGGTPTSVGGGGAGGFTAPSCKAHPAGTATVSVPTLMLTLKDRWEEAWLGSPAVADLDGDGKQEMIVPRDGALVVWNADGTLRWKFSGTSGRIWSSAVVADLRDDARLEIAFAARDEVFMLNADGQVLSGFPVTWEDEMRSLAAGDVDGDGKLDLVATPGHDSPTDVMNAWHADGSRVAGFPPNAAGVSGCDEHCYLAGCYDQNLALGDLDGDSKEDVVVPHDNTYASFHKNTGEAFDAAAIFQDRKKTPGVRYLHDLPLAEQGYADDEATALQAHFTNTAPAITDVDGDGINEIVMLGSVQNAAQTDRYRGVALWVVRHDASRLPGWETPLHVPAYLAGLWDYEGTNVVAATNQVSVADIDPSRPGPEFVFAGFDGKIHAVGADRTLLWSTTYTTDPNVLTGGVVVGDLSGDGVPEIVFNSYSVDDAQGALIVLDAAGRELHRVALPGRGAMPVPTLADVDGNGTVEIVVSLKDAEDRVQSVLVYTVASSSADCLLWPTGRANLLRNGRVKTQ